MSRNEVNHQYHGLLRKILAEGNIVSNDRTGTGTRSLFGQQMRFDLKKGFPLISTKFVSFSVTVKELLWFIRGDTNNRWLQKQNVKIWNEWANEDGDLFDIYGKQMRRLEIPNPNWGLIEIRSSEDDGLPGPILKFALKDESLVTEKGAMTGGRFKNHSGLEFVVLDYLGASHYVVQFLESGSICEAHSSNLKAGNIQDEYYPSVYGVGYIGCHRGDGKRTTRRDRAYKMWKSMIGRCYDAKHSSFTKYGGAGVSVCKRWHCFENYLADLSTLPGYESWLRFPDQYHLDKDYYGARQYGPKTCVFLHEQINALISNAIPVKVGDDIYPTIKNCAEKLNCKYQTLKSVLSGKVLKTKEKIAHDVSFYTTPAGFVYRPILFLDQLQALIDGLKANPHSRRHIISLWNSADSDRAALPACHSMTQFYVRADGDIKYLSCHLYQRSADMFLGVPVNIASYALLTHMVAHVVNMTPDELVWTGGDCHIYSNHESQVREQLTRDPDYYPMPTLSINNSRILSFIDDFMLHDLEITGYQSFPAIKAPIAI